MFYEYSVEWCHVPGWTCNFVDTCNQMWCWPFTGIAWAVVSTEPIMAIGTLWQPWSGGTKYWCVVMCTPYIPPIWWVLCHCFFFKLRTNAYYSNVFQGLLQENWWLVSHETHSSRNAQIETVRFMLTLCFLFLFFLLHVWPSNKLSILATSFMQAQIIPGPLVTTTTQSQVGGSTAQSVIKDSNATCIPTFLHSAWRVVFVSRLSPIETGTTDYWRLGFDTKYFIRSYQPQISNPSLCWLVRCALGVESRPTWSDVDLKLWLIVLLFMILGPDPNRRPIVQPQLSPSQAKLAKLISAYSSLNGGSCANRSVVGTSGTIIGFLFFYRGSDSESSGSTMMMRILAWLGK